MSEWEGRLEVLVPIARGQSFRVDDIAIAGRDRIRLRCRHHHRQAASWRMISEDHGSKSGARLLTAQEHGQNGLDGVPPRHRHRPWNHCEHDGPLFGGGDRADEAVGIAVQLQVGAVRVLSARRPGYNDDDVGLPGRIHGNGGVITRRGDHLHPRCGCTPPESLQGRHHIGPNNVSAAAPRVVVTGGPVSAALPDPIGVEGLRHRRLAYHGDCSRRLGREWQDMSLVLEHHDGFRGEPSSEGLRGLTGHIPLEEGLTIRGGAPREPGEVHAVHHSEDRQSCLVDHRGRMLGQPLGGEVNRAPGPWHLLVQAVFDACAVHGPPVGHDEAPEAHTLPQDLLQLLRVLAGVGSVHLVVGAHSSRDAGLDCGLEWRVVQFPCCLVVNVR
mmetsp:Transcript_131306/g.280826  ORF Transcript_131306/g.280826 Transcript_131306/m.280826 type:complete len:385 (+) Transcript_131306:1276-2430(+)